MTSAIFMACVVVLSSPTQPERELIKAARTAGAEGDYAAAAEAFAELANRTTGPARLPMVFAAAANWHRAFEAEPQPELLCRGLELLSATATDEPEIVAEREWFMTTADANAVECSQRNKNTELGETANAGQMAKGANHQAQPSNPDVKPTNVKRTPQTSVDATPNSRGQDIPREHTPSTKWAQVSKLRLAGTILTSIGAAGTVAITTQSVVYANQLGSFKAAPSFDAAQYNHVRRLEGALISTAVVTGAALVSGITSLVVSHKRRVHVQPTLGGVVFGGKF